MVTFTRIGPFFAGRPSSFFVLILTAFSVNEK